MTFYTKIKATTRTKVNGSTVKQSFGSEAKC